MEKERGYTICGNGRLKKGPEVIGEPSRVAIPIACPRGSKPVGLMHTHPGHSLELSPQDIRTMKE